MNFLASNIQPIFNFYFSTIISSMFIVGVKQGVGLYAGRLIRGSAYTRVYTVGSIPMGVRRTDFWGGQTIFLDCQKTFSQLLFEKCTQS